jgi:hypothetical protein
MTAPGKNSSSAHTKQSDAEPITTPSLALAYRSFAGFLRKKKPALTDKGRRRYEVV